MSGPDALVAGRYRLESELGRGGMGVVWEAYDVLLRRRVAAKEICYPEGVGPAERERLSARTLREARAVAAIDDPHALRVFDIIEQDGRPWIVMELVRGRTLTDEIRARGALPATEVARIGLSLVDALVAAHRAGVLHRDVKPSNVILGFDGSVKLTDFGIAAIDDDDADTTATGLIMGSPGYVAPERARGHKPTAAADFWSLGATLWTAAEARPPYRGTNSFETMLRVVSEDPPACETCDPRLVEVLQGLMARDPSVRPSPEEIRRQLESVVAATSTSAVATAPVTGAASVAGAASNASQLDDSFDATTVLAGPSPEPGEADRVLPLSEIAGDGATYDWPSYDGRRRRRLAPVLGVVALLVAVVAAGAVALSGQGSDAKDTASPPVPTHSAKAQHHTATGGSTSGGSTAGGAVKATSSGPSTPAGWQRYKDPSIGWSVAVPAGWTVEHRSDGTTVFHDPAGGRTLLVGTRYPPGPSAKGAWEDEEPSFARSHADYRRIKLDNVSWRNYPDVADWEFTYVDGGAALHAVDRGAVINGRGYGLFFQTRTSQWDASQDVLQGIYGSFSP